MKVKAQLKMIEDKKMLLVHFIDGRPNLRGERFKTFVSKLEEILKVKLNGVRIVLTPYQLKDCEEIVIPWSRFDEIKFRLKDFVEY